MSILIDFRKEEGVGFVYISSIEDLTACIKWLEKHKEEMIKAGRKADSIIDVFKEKDK